MTARETGAVELRIVFDGPPGPESGRFVECETPDGKSVNAGEWHERSDGLWELRLSRPQPTPSATGEIVERLGRKIESNGAWMTSDLRAFYIELRDAFEQQAATIAERDGENERLHIAINDGLHWIARGQVDRAEAVLRSTLERTRGQ
jgi:hypothetical protein